MGRYVGIDLHRRRSVIVVLDDDGEELWSTKIDNDPATLAAAITKAGPDPEVVLEATWGWYWAADVIAEAGGRVHLAHPLGIAGFENRRVKNDQIDARLLADLLRMGRLPEAWIAPGEVREQRELVRYRRKLSQLRAGLKAQVHAVIGKEGLVPPMAHLWGPGGRGWLDDTQMAPAFEDRLRSLRRLALVLTAPDELRQPLRGLTTKALTKRCAGFRDAPQRPIAERCARNTMRSIARRIIAFNDEVKLHDDAIGRLIAEAAPQLVDEPGIGHVTAAMFVIAWSHPGRCRNEAAFARLAGVAPLPATSGQSQDRHRLNRSGDRQLNSALYVVALCRARYHPPTRDYVERRRAEGRTDREIRRCLKRYIARRVWRLLEHPPTTDITG